MLLALQREEFFLMACHFPQPVGRFRRLRRMMGQMRLVPLACSGASKARLSFDATVCAHNRIFDFGKLLLSVVLLLVLFLVDTSTGR